MLVVLLCVGRNGMGRLMRSRVAFGLLNCTYFHRVVGLKDGFDLLVAVLHGQVKGIVKIFSLLCGG